MNIKFVESMFIQGSSVIERDTLYVVVGNDKKAHTYAASTGKFDFKCGDFVHIESPRFFSLQCVTLLRHEPLYPYSEKSYQGWLKWRKVKKMRNIKDKLAINTI